MHPTSLAVSTAVPYMKINVLLWAAWLLYWLISAASARKNEISEARRSRLLHLAFIAIAFALLFSDRLDVAPFQYPLRAGSRFFGPLGDIVTAGGLGFAVWARLHLGRYWSGRITLKEGHRLIRTGPYRLTRHPIYTGFLTAVLGSALTLNELRGPLAFVIVLAAYFRKIHREEKTLKRAFGSEYETYRREVKALVPFMFLV